MTSDHQGRTNIPSKPAISQTSAGSNSTSSTNNRSVNAGPKIARLKTPLTDVLGIEAPILQSGMAGVAGPELVAAVSNAGGLGVLAALRLTPDQISAAISEVRALTNKPFGVNIWLHDDVRQPPDPATLSEDHVRAVQSVLNDYRPRFDLPTTLAHPEPTADLVDDALQIMIEERVPVFSAAIGIPEQGLVERFHSAGTKVMSMVATVSDGVAAVANGVDVIVAQGTEAGGHRSYGSKLGKLQASGPSTFTLVAELRDALRAQRTAQPLTPLAAAGGIVDGRSMAAMMVLGADGVLLGTRFVATRESTASDVWKQRLITGPRNTTLTDGFTGQWARVLTSEFSDRWESENIDALPGLLQGTAGKDLFAMARKVGDDQFQPLYAGAAASSMSNIIGAGEVVTQMISEARSAIDAANRLSQGHFG